MGLVVAGGVQGQGPEDLAVEGEDPDVEVGDEDQGTEQAARQAARAAIEQHLGADESAGAYARGAEMSARELQDYLLEELDAALSSNP